MNFYKKSGKKAPAIGIQFNHGDVLLKPNYFKKQRSSSSIYLPEVDTQVQNGYVA